jgi:hypothetical protein
MGNRFYPGQRDYVAQLNAMDDAIGAAGSATSPVFQNLAVNGASNFKGPVTASVASGNVANFTQTTRGQEANLVVSALGGSRPVQMNLTAHDDAFLPYGVFTPNSGGVYTAAGTMAFLSDLNGIFTWGNAAEKMRLSAVGDLILGAGKFLYKGGNPEAVRLENNSGYVSFVASDGNSRIGYVQASNGVAMTLMADIGTPQLLLGVNGVSRVSIGNAGWLMPTADNTQNLGWSNARWANAYVGTIISTSDARKKTPVKPMSDAMRVAARELLDCIGIYQWLDAIAEKGKDKARWHVGMTVQGAIAVLEKHQIDPFSLGFICHDTWPDEYERRQINIGEKIIKHRDVVQQKTIEHERDHEVIEIVDGKPVLVSKPVKITEPVFVDVPVSRPDGSLVMLETGQPMTVRMPELETVPEQYEVDADPVYEDVLIRPAGECYSFRYDELNLFILAGVGQ